MAWHNQLHLELKNSVFMLPFCCKFWEGLMNLRNIKMEASKVILISNRESTSITENLCGGNPQKTLGTGKPAVACSNCYAPTKANGIWIYITVLCTLEYLLCCCLLIGFLLLLLFEIGDSRFKGHYSNIGLDCKTYQMFTAYKHNTLPLSLFDLITSKKKGGNDT